MIQIDFPEPRTDEWRKWRDDCDSARDRLLEACENGQAPSFTELYKHPRMRPFYKSLQGAFHGKCAYCETMVVGFPGDIDHYRPKGAVSDETGKTAKIRAPDGSEMDHPGYYWLAYEWTNLVLSCSTCNRYLRSPMTGRRIGKWTCFPVRGFRASRMGEESRERPLLLNPVYDDPADHLEVDETGIMIAKSARGQMCITIFGLNDQESLVNERARCVKHTVNLLALIRYRASSADGQADDLRELFLQLREIEDGRVPYSAAGRAVIVRFRDGLAHGGGGT